MTGVQTCALPISTLTAILATAIIIPVLSTVDLLDEGLRLWIPVVCPSVAVLLWVVYRDVATALVGALPLLIGRFFVTAFGPPNAPGWGPFLWAMLALLALFIAADWFGRRPVDGERRQKRRPRQQRW